MKPSPPEPLALAAEDVTREDLQLVDLVIESARAQGFEFHPAHRIHGFRAWLQNALAARRP